MYEYNDFEHDEHDEDLQVPAPSPDSRDRHEAPQAALTPPAEAPTAAPPSILGAFTNLIQRMGPGDDQASPRPSPRDNRDPPASPFTFAKTSEGVPVPVPEPSPPRRLSKGSASPEPSRIPGENVVRGPSIISLDDDSPKQPANGRTVGFTPEVMNAPGWQINDAPVPAEKPAEESAGYGWANALGLGNFFFNPAPADVPSYRDGNEVPPQSHGRPRQENSIRPVHEANLDDFDSSPTTAGSSTAGPSVPAVEKEATLPRVRRYASEDWDSTDLTKMLAPKAGDEQDWDGLTYCCSLNFYQHSGIVLRFVGWLMSAYTRKCTARCPCCCAFIYFIAVFVFIGVGFVIKPLDIESNFDSFMKTDVNSSLLRDTFVSAVKARSEEERRRLLPDDLDLEVVDRSPGDRRLQSGAQLYKNSDVYIAYVLKDTYSGRSVFDQAVLSQVAKIENRLRGLSEWKTMCQATSTPDNFVAFCDPGISLLAYALPSMNVPLGSIVPDEMRFDAKGSNSVPLDTTLRALEQQSHPGEHDRSLYQIIMPRGFEDSTASTLRKFRSVFRFRYYCCDSTDPYNQQKAKVAQLSSDWEKFVVETLLPELQEASDDEENKVVDIYWDGDKFETIEVLQSLFGDIFRALGSMLFVLCYLMFHTQSAFLGAMGLLIVVVSVPFAYVVFAILAGTSKMSLASFLSLFLVVGLGSDVVFVFTDFWRHAERMDELEDEGEKMLWTLHHAGKASLATTITTALSFFANLVSVLRPLREFAMFMGLCVVLVWVLIALIYLPLCAVDSRYLAKYSLRCSKSESRSVDHEQSSRQTALARVTGFIWRFRRYLVLLPSTMGIVCLALAISFAETDTGVPDIFPEDHNQNAGKEVLEMFNSPNDVMKANYMTPRDTGAVCSERDFRSSDAENCPLFWCEVKSSLLTTVSTDQTCSCFQKDNPQSCGNASARIEAISRFIGPSTFTEDDGIALASHIFNTSRLSLGFSTASSSMSDEAMAPLRLQEWETGDMMLKPMTQVTSQLRKQNGDPSCGFTELCYCGTYICQHDESVWRQVEDLKLPSFTTGSTALANPWGRRLRSEPVSLYPPRILQTQTFTVPTDQRASVDIVFGLLVNEVKPLLGEPEDDMRWTFMPETQLQQPWAQRNLLSFCKEAATQGNLKVADRRCWIEGFASWLPSQGKMFPVLENDFHRLAIRWATGSLTGLTSSKDFLWIRDYKVKGCFFTFAMDQSKTGGTESAIALMKQWDRYMEGWNVGASSFVTGAWHTSDLWVRAQAQSELISSTVLTLVVVLVLAFGGMLIFTQDMVLSVFVVVATIYVISLLAFFITTLMRWAIGPIEVIALIVFIGYAVTYSLHIAHKYGGDRSQMKAPSRHDLSESQRERYMRVDFALKAIGGAAVGSAITTMGCALFLVFCTLTIFQKLGGVVLVVTFFSILTALGPVPAALMMFGPTNPGPYNCPKRANIAQCAAGLSGFCSKMLTRKPVQVQTRASGEQRPSVYDRDITTRSVPDEAHIEFPVDSDVHAVAGAVGGVASPAPYKVSVTAPQPRSTASAPQAPLSNVAGRVSEVQVDDVRLSEKAFDIGEESPLDPIWARDHGEPASKIISIGKVRVKGNPRRGNAPIQTKPQPRRPRATE